MHGWQHTSVNLSALLPSTGALLWLGHPDTALAFSAAFLFGTLLVTPDLDLQLNDARRRWGPLRFIWAPYAALSRHRGMSHTYFAGPLVRLAYLAVWCLPVVALALSLNLDDFPPVIPLTWVITALLGYFTSQWLHLLCDGILPFQSRTPKRRKRS
jgi:uncharacterized metal-binding protein